MSVKEIQERLYSELTKRVRVAIQEEGFHNDNFEAVFDAYNDTGSLTTLEEINAQLNGVSAASYEAHKRALSQAKDIKDALSNFSNELAKKAAGAGIEKIEKVNPKVFDTYASIFEKKNKTKLSVVMPTLLSAFLP
jgi:glutamyl-tRNA reductase